MIKQEYSVIGVMSGTSLDGIDLVYARFKYNGNWRFEIINAETSAYDEWYDILKNLILYTPEKLELIDVNYTTYLAGVINNFITKNDIDNIDAVCSHGHTALHRPDKKLTYQIGNKPFLATALKETVVCDFRVQDVELGGQGAPLVPIGDELLFSVYDFCLNLGGFANISTNDSGKRIAYDICPVNIMLNYYAKILGYDYDDSGKIAATGMVNKALFDALNALDFYHAPYPKSLGLEWVNINVFPLIDSYSLEVKDVLRTLVEHIAYQISLVLAYKRGGTVLITGGGVYNDFLIKKIKLVANNDIIIPSKAIIEFKEALIFGLLGVLKLRNEVNCLQSVTGALKDHSSGKIFRP